MHFDGLRWAASGAGNVYPYRTPEFPQCFRRILFCCSIISFMHSVLSVLLRFTVHDYPFDLFKHFQNVLRGRRGRECIVDGFTTTYAIGAYHHWARMPLRTVRARYILFLPRFGWRHIRMLVFLYIYLRVIYSIAGKNLEDTPLELVCNVHKERQLKLTIIFIWNLKIKKRVWVYDV